MFTLDEVKRIAKIQSEVQNFSEKVRDYISDNLDDLLILLDPDLFYEGISEERGIEFYQDKLSVYDIDYHDEISIPYKLLTISQDELKSMAQQIREELKAKKQAQETSYQKYLEEQDYQRFLELKAKFESNPGDIT